MADLLVAHQEIPVGEKNLPVVIAQTDKLNIQRTGRRHVMADVEEVFKEPEEAESRASDFAAKEERDGTSQRHNQLHQSAAQNHQHIAEASFIRPGKNSKQRMARLVNGQISVIDEEKPGAV